jgi:hypothetical protein
MKWIDLCENILSAFGIAYDFEQYDCTAEQLPDTFIVYFLVDDIGVCYSDNVETAHEPRIQVSLFYRDKSMYLTLPHQIETAFMTCGFTRAGSGRIPFQNDTRHYGWRCDFRFYEKR